MKRDAWMSSFYGRNWWVVESLRDLEESLPCGLVEWRIDAGDIRSQSLAQNLGFTLVETVLEFETVVQPSSAVHSGVRVANAADFPAVMSITDECIIQNDKFINRFKHPNFFSQDQMSGYFRQAVTNYFDSKNSVTVVYESESRVLAYYICQELKPGRFKGVLTGVRDPAKGQRIHAKMQQVAINSIRCGKITLVNSTQLSNYNAINSHIRNMRVLARSEYVFYRTIDCSSVSPGHC